MHKVITIAHQKGGVGKSTIALNLAVELSKKYPLKVIDLDFQKSLTIFNEHRREMDLPPLEVVGVKNNKELTEIIKKSEGIILIDSGGFDSDLNRLALLHSNFIITPLSNSLIEIYGLQSFQQILEELQEIKEEIKSYILLNNIHPNTKKGIEEIRGFIQEKGRFFRMLDAVLRRRSEFARSFEEGRSVVEINPLSKASKELMALIEEIEMLI